jgi:hypothetical protein
MKNKCLKCYGFGWWAIGDLVPLGEMDAREYGKFTIKCPWCNAGFEKGEKYELLKRLKDGEDEKQKI